MAGETGMYSYDTPDGYEDIFFVYVFDSGAANLVSGQDYVGLQILVDNGAFVCRAWNGAYSVLSQTAGSLGQIQIFGMNLDKWFDNPVQSYSLNPTGQCAAVPGVLEKFYGVNTAIRFDLYNTAIRVI